MKAAGYRGNTTDKSRLTIITAENQDFADRMLETWLKECGHELKDWPKWFEKISMEIE